MASSDSTFLVNNLCLAILYPLKTRENQRFSGGTNAEALARSKLN